MSTNEPRSRGFGRLPLGISAHLITLHGRKSVRLLDLSQGGAQVTFPADLPVRDCMLTWLTFEVFCSAAWQEGGKLGLRFDRPLPLATLVATRNVAPAIIREEALDSDADVRGWVQGRW